MQFKYLAVTFLVALNFSQPAVAKVVEYVFAVDYTQVAPAGTLVQAMTIDGGIPGPTIEATEGDLLKVTFNNLMDVETSIHWHGIMLPPDQDGVPHLNTRAIEAGGTFTFEFPVRHAGTYWYHSHTGLQEQRGIYGSIVFHPKANDLEVDHDKVVVFSDWIDENPQQVMRNLKRDGDYYALKKESVQSWDKVLAHGSEAIKARLNSAWSRMDPMDLSDIGYDAFLTNGEQSVAFTEVEAGQVVRLRLINAGASTYFDVEFAGGTMTVISADGMPTQPVEVKRLRIAVAETYDILVTIPSEDAFELRATSIDGTGFTSLFLGQGAKVMAPDIAKPNLFASIHSGHTSPNHSEATTDAHAMHMDHSAPMHHNHQMDDKTSTGHMIDYDGLRAQADTAYADERPVRGVELRLTGNMERYVWNLNNKPLSVSDRILIRRGEVVQFTLTNTTMMNHPMHLHGHFFRVLNGEGNRSPLKHTVNVPAMSSVTIEFVANEERDWFFHCHMLYHMAAGMAAVVSYEETSEATQETLRRMAKDRHWYSFGDVGFQSNKATGGLWTGNTYNQFSLSYDYDWHDTYEVDIEYQRFVGRYLSLYAGARIEGEDLGHEERLGVVGLRYLLPLNIEVEVDIDTNGHIRLELGSSLQLTDRLNFMWEWDTDNEYELSLDYEINKQFSIIASHGKHYGTGAGLMVKF